MQGSEQHIQELFKTYKPYMDIADELEDNILSEIKKEKNYKEMFNDSMKRAKIGIATTCLFLVIALIRGYFKLSGLIESPSTLPLIFYSLMASLLFTFVTYLFYHIKKSIEKSTAFESLNS